MPFFAKKLLTFALAAVMLAVAGPALAQTAKAKVPIEISSDRLASNPAQKYVEFSGNVKVLYDIYRINSSQLRIYYTQKQNAADDNPLAVEGITSIAAIGNVTVVSPEYDIKSEKAEYDIATGLGTFTGKEVRVTQDKNVITGSKITINRNTGRISVDGGNQGRIKAVFYTDDNLDDVLKP